MLYFNDRPISAYDQACYAMCIGMKKHMQIPWMLSNLKTSLSFFARIAEAVDVVDAGYVSCSRWLIVTDAWIDLGGIHI